MESRQNRNGSASSTSARTGSWSSIPVRPTVGKFGSLVEYGNNEDDTVIANQLLNISKTQKDYRSASNTFTTLAARVPTTESAASAAIAKRDSETGESETCELDGEADMENEADNENEAENDSETGQDGNAVQESKDRIPIILVFEPKVLRIFKAYNKAVSPHKQFDCSGHLMVMCLQHIVDFCCWARSSEQNLNWITSEVNGNVDLRPRVRNGLTLLFVYAVAAAKAETFGNTDMFTVMQDADSGLGIANRTSLKIYNDYLNYYTFLKSCLSGLILAGLVAENERSNQVMYMPSY
jgi:hypothetical protein